MTRAELISRLRTSHASNETLCNVMHVWKEEEVIPYIPMLELISHCCKCTGVTIENVRGKSREQDLVRARQLFCYQGRGWYKLKNMGVFLGGRDHTTVIHARDKAIDLYSTKDPVFLYDYENLKRSMRGDELNPITPKYQPTPRFYKVVEGRKKTRYIFDHQTAKKYTKVCDLLDDLGLCKHQSLSSLIAKNKNRFETFFE